MVVTGWRSEGVVSMAKQNPQRKKGNPQQSAKNVPPVPSKVTNPQEIQTRQDKYVHDGSNDVPRQGLFRGVNRADRYALYIASAALVINLLTLWHIKTDSRLEYRAWIGVMKGIPDQMSLVVIGGQPACRMEFTNTGKTPALDVSIQHSMYPGAPLADIEVIAMPLEDKAQYPPKSLGAVPPNGEIAVNSHCNGTLSNKFKTEIEEGRIILYAFGRVSYRDIFGVEHTTRYCYTIDLNTNEMKAYHQYNSMD